MFFVCQSLQLRIGLLVSSAAQYKYQNHMIPQHLVGPLEAFLPDICSTLEQMSETTSQLLLQDLYTGSQDWRAQKFTLQNQHLIPDKMKKFHHELPLDVLIASSSIYLIYRSYPLPNYGKSRRTSQVEIMNYVWLKVPFPH